MTESDTSSDRPVDDPDVLYTCGDCGEMYEWEDVEMVQHPEDEQQAFPICFKETCRIDHVPLPGVGQ